jgi:hypothetical protein
VIPSTDLSPSSISTSEFGFDKAVERTTSIRQPWRCDIQLIATRVLDCRFPSVCTVLGIDTEFSCEVMPSTLLGFREL